MQFIKSIFLFFFFFFTNTHLHTQTASGWRWVEENNFLAAKSTFEAAIKKNPNDESSLIGLMWVFETLRDDDNYRRCANQLIRNGWKGEYLQLFGHLFDGLPEEVLKQPNLPISVRSQWMFRQSDSLFLQRKFEAYMKISQALVPDGQWWLTGPFTNLRGSGWAEVNAPETLPFDANQTFSNENGVEFGWWARRDVPPGSFLNFSRLPQHEGMATFFAQTFLKNPVGRQIRLLITRHEPIKIWLDDQLLLERPRQTAHVIDLESVTFFLPAGTHRLLIKLSEFPDPSTKTNLVLAFNEVKNDASVVQRQYGRPNLLGNFFRENDTELLLRFCDPSTGETLQDLTTHFDGKYLPATDAWQVQFSENELLESLLKQAQQPHDFYILAKAFAFFENYEAGEAYFFNYLKKNPTSNFAKFLLSKFYAANGKDDRAEALLSELAPQTCPTMAMQLLILQKINADQNENEYLQQLESMLALTPTHFGLIKMYLEHLQSKGKKEKMRGFIRKFLDENKDEKWKSRLEKFLENESYKPESYSAPNDKKREKEYQAARKRLKKRFSFQDYSVVIEYLKYKNRRNEVLKVMDEMITIMPWSPQRKLRKATYLFEIEKHDEALALLQNILPAMPYSREVLETIGDIYFEKKDEQQALEWYQKAMKWNKSNSLRQKIEKISPPQKFNGYFETIPLETIARQPLSSDLLEKYRGEESVITLYSQQMTYLPAENKVQGIRKLVIHILNDAGAKTWTEADFRSMGRITSAKVLKKDGTVTSPILEYRTAVFKNLQAGDIILMEGFGEQGMKDEISNDFLYFDMLSWQAPVALASLELLLPKDVNLHAAANRLDTTPISRRDTAQFSHWKWQWKHLPKLEREDATPQNLDTYAWLMLGTAPNWSKIVQWYQRKTYCRTEPNYEILEKARSLVHSSMSKEQIVEALHTFVTTEINYSFVPFLNSNYVPKKSSETLAGKVGDCKDVATLMITLLHEYNIEAWYVLAETHSFSRLAPRPAIYAFNHAIVAYRLDDGVTRFADLTTDYYPNGVLPEFDSDAWGLVIRDGENELTRLPNDALNPQKSRVEIVANASLDVDKNLKIEMKSTNFGCPAGRWREQLIPAAPLDRRKLLSEYFGAGVLNHLDFESIDFENLENTNAPLHLNLDLQSFNPLDRVANFWIMPLPLPLSTPTHRALFAAKRYNVLDIDELFELAPVKETITMTLPNDYVLMELPQNQEIDSKFGKYHLHFESSTNGKLIIRREMQWRLRFIEPSDFLDFKKFYLAMLDADDTKLALRRK